MGEIYAYYGVDIDDFKRVLYLGCPIQSGTNKLSWSMTGRNAVAVQKSGGGHHMNIVGYDDDLTRTDGYGNVYTGFFIIENTWGENWGDRGRYYLPYSIADKVLYNTRLAMVVDKAAVEKRATDLIANLDDRLDELVTPSLEVAIEAGFISNTNLDNPITRRDTGIVAGRIYKKIIKDFKTK